MNDADRINMLPPGMLRQAAIAKAARAAQLDAMMQEAPPQVGGSPGASMTQGQFSRPGAADPRALRQQQLIQMLRQRAATQQ